jgi:hypothetical protein
MLGLGSSITSGVPESKYSVSFDGTDHIDTNQTFQSIFRGSFAISFWIKPNDGIPSSTQFLFGATGSSGDVIRFSIVNDGTFMFYFQSTNDSNQNITLRTSSAILSDGAATSWTHVIIDVTKPASGNTSAVMYINGQQQTSLQTSNFGLTTANHALFTTATNLPIGARRQSASGPQDFYSGLIDEFGIYNIALDDVDVVSKIYNDGVPKNLTLVDEDGINDNLQLYYKMGDGLFDDKANGEINNQVNPGRGSNLITNGNYSNGTTGWVVSDSNSSDQGLAINGSGQLVITSSNGVNGLAIQALTSSTVVGKTYKLKLDIISATKDEDDSFASILNKIRIGTLNGTLPTPSSFSEANITDDASLSAGVNVFYFTASEAHTHLAIGGRDDVDILIIDNVSFEEFNANPGITSSGNVFTSDTP